MKSWTTYLIPVFIILTGVVVGQKILQNNQSKPAKSGYLQAVAGISESSIDNLVISDDKGTLTLNKQNGTWKLDGKNADQQVVNNIISVILDKNGGNYELVSQNPGRFSDLSVGDASAKVTLKSGNVEKLTLIVGSSNYPGTFVRPQKENSVYLTSQSLGEISTAQRQNYFDKAVLNLTQDKLSKIDVNYKAESYTLTKSENKWKLEKSNKEVDESKMSSFLRGLESLKADKVVESAAEKNNYTQKYGSLKIETTDGKSETVDVYKGKSDLLLQRKSDGQMFTSSQSLVDSFLKQSRDLTK